MFFGADGCIISLMIEDILARARRLEASGPISDAAEAYLAASRVLFEGRKIREATEALNKAIRLFDSIGMVREALEACEESAAAIEKGVPARERLLFMSSYACLLLQGGFPKEAKEQRARLVRFYSNLPPAESRELRPYYLSWLGEYDFCRDNYCSAAELLEEAREEGDLGPICDCLLAISWLMLLKTERCEDLIERMRSGQPRISLMASYFDAVIKLMRGKHEEALTAFSTLLDGVRMMADWKVMMWASFCLAILHATMRNLGTARTYIDTGRAVASSSGSKVMVMHFDALGEALFPRGDRRLMEIRDEAASLGYAGPRAIAELGLSAFYLSREDEDLATDALERCFALADENGLWGMISMVGHAVPETLGLAARRGLGGQGLARIAEMNPRVRLGRSEVKLFLLGRREAVLGKKRISFPGIQGELLAFLAMNRSEPISRERLTGLFWPEYDDARGRRRFYIAMSEIRSALKGIGARLPSKRPRERVDLGIDFWTDAEEFAALVRTARALRRAGQEEQALGFYERAVELYYGEFLPGAVSPWAHQERDFFRLMFIEAQIFVGEASLRTAPEDALERARRILREDPFNEGAAALVIKALRAMNQEAEARRFSERFKREFREAFGSEPESLPDFQAP